jgi:hypothetical protein
MTEPIFLDKSKQPAEKELKQILGPVFDLWQDIKHFIKNEIGKTSEDWKFYMAKTGWQLKTLLKNRNLFFFTPYKNHFRITFVFGDKAVSEIQKSDVPQTVIDELVNAKKYMEGRGLSLEVKSKNDVEVIKKLLLIKLNN